MCFTSVNYSGHTHKYMCSTINYSELNELCRDSTTVNKSLFSTIRPLISLCLSSSPLEGEVDIGLLVLWQPQPGDGWPAGSLGREKCLPCPPQPPLISAKDKIPGKR